MFKESETNKPIEQLKRESKMMDQILTLLIRQVPDYDRPMLETIVNLWRKGERAKSQLECLALDNCRQRWRLNTCSDCLEPRKEILSLVWLMLLDDINPDCDTARNT